MPGIEFVKGIPADVEEDWYLNEVTELLLTTKWQKEPVIRGLLIYSQKAVIIETSDSVNFLLQKLFHQGLKISRKLSLSSHYFVLFKHPRDKMYGRENMKKLSVWICTRGSKAQQRRSVPIENRRATKRSTTYKVKK